MDELPRHRLPQTPPSRNRHNPLANLLKRKSRLVPLHRHFQLLNIPIIQLHLNLHLPQLKRVLEQQHLIPNRLLHRYAPGSTKTVISREAQEERNIVLIELSMNSFLPKAVDIAISVDGTWLDAAAVVGGVDQVVVSAFEEVAAVVGGCDSKEEPLLQEDGGCGHGVPGCADAAGVEEGGDIEVGEDHFEEFIYA